MSHLLGTALADCTIPGTVRTFNTNYTLFEDDFYVLHDGGAAVTITLPDFTTIDCRSKVVFVKSTTAQQVTFQAAAGVELEGNVAGAVTSPGVATSIGGLRGRGWILLYSRDLNAWDILAQLT